MKKIALAIVAALSALSLVVAPGRAASPAPGPGDWRPLDADNTLVIDTNKGRIIVELYPLAAPATVAQVKTLARQHLYDGLTFFRVIDGFMDQTGDPKNDGTGGSSLPNLPAEFTFKHAPGVGVTDITPIPAGVIGYLGAMPVVSAPAALAALTVDGKVKTFGLFCTGVIGMARAEAEDTGNSQFFLMRAEHFDLDQKYTAFGRVVQGQAVVDAIKTGEPVSDPQDKMLTVQVLADMPAASRPNLQVLDTAGAYFKAEAARLRAVRRDDFNPCAVPIQTTGR